VAASIAATRARFDAVSALVSLDAGPAAPVAALRRQHEALTGSLRRRINALTTAGVEAAYGKVRRNLEDTIPAFLRRQTPLAAGEVVAGLEELRPSRAAAAIDRLVNEFLNKLTPMLGAIEGPVNGFFRGLQEVVRLLDPLSLRDAVASIYTTIRARVRILDPATLAESLRANVLKPVLDAIGALDPEALKARLDAVYHRVVEALRTTVGGIFADIAAAIDVELRGLRERLTAFTRSLASALQTAIETIQRVIGMVEQLLFVELVERLRTLVQNLDGSFGRELDRVRNAFDEMLNAIPLGGAGASAAVTIG
jgi:hypothetical protein